MEIEIREADFDAPADAAAVVEIIDAYARESGGQGKPLSVVARDQMAGGLRAHPLAMVLLARSDAQSVGVAVCIFGFSTFAGRPLLNIHDLAVLPAYRGRGIGRALLAEAERRAVARGCCKLTLEVDGANHGARRLYEELGFGFRTAPTYFMTKQLAE